MKKDIRRSTKLLLFIALVLSSKMGIESVLAQDNVQKAATKTPAAPSKVKFRPPPDDAPAGGVRGGSRGSGDSTMTLDVRAPNEPALTTMEQPSLFCFQPKPANARFELTLLQENKAKPLVQFKVE